MGYYDKYLNIDVLNGKVLTKIVVNDHNDRIEFTTSDGNVYCMYHEQDCCESVDIEDINGDLQTLIGHPIIRAEEVTNDQSHPDGYESPEYGHESFTWTFYTISTIKETVTIRWFGESNGYYSESVEFVSLNPA